MHKPKIIKDSKTFCSTCVSNLVRHYVKTFSAVILFSGGFTYILKLPLSHPQKFALTSSEVVIKM